MKQVVITNVNAVITGEKKIGNTFAISQFFVDNSAEFCPWTKIGTDGLYYWKNYVKTSEETLNISTHYDKTILEGLFNVKESELSMKTFLYQ